MSSSYEAARTCRWPLCSRMVDLQRAAHLAGDDSGHQEQQRHAHASASAEKKERRRLRPRSRQAILYRVVSSSTSHVVQGFGRFVLRRLARRVERRQHGDDHHRQRALQQLAPAPAWGRRAR